MPEYVKSVRIGISTGSQPPQAVRHRHSGTGSFRYYGLVRHCPAMLICVGSHSDVTKRSWFLTHMACMIWYLGVVKMTELKAQRICNIQVRIIILNMEICFYPFLPITIEHLSYLSKVNEIQILKSPLQAISNLSLINLQSCKGQISPQGRCEAKLYIPVRPNQPLGAQRHYPVKASGDLKMGNSF